MLDQIVIEAFRRIGRRAEVVFTPTARSLVETDEGLTDGEINRIEGMEKQYPNLIRVPEPNMQMHFVAFAKRDIPIDGWESLKDLKIGIVRGWKILENHTQDFACRTLLVDSKQLFEMQDRGRLDVVLYSKLGGKEKIKACGFTELHALDPPLISRDMFLYMNKRHKELVIPLAEALRGMKQDGTYDSIVAKTCQKVK